MFQIFLGSIFLLFDITVSSYYIDVLPDFIGWLLVAYGLKKLSQHSGVFTGVKIAGIFMILISILQAVITFMGSNNFVYTYLLKHYGIDHTDSTLIFSSVFWMLKFVVFTITVLVLVKIKDRLSDTQSIKRLRTVWLIILGIEIFTFIYKTLIMNYLPDIIQTSILQILVIGAIFFRIWFIFSGFKIAKDYKPY